MSRCFPYPPPGYAISKASNDALIEWIKLQKEREKAKAERKKEKKEKKEKKKAKDEKAKQATAGPLDHDVCGGKSWENIKGGFLQKERKDDTEQLERSSITEEHQQPAFSQKPSYSSDSTQNSSKRTTAVPLNRTRVQGNILRIRLPSQKHIQHDVKDRNEQLCSTSGRTDLPAKLKNDGIRTEPDKSCSTSLATDFIVDGLILRPDQELTLPISSQQPDITSQEIIHADSGSKRYRKLKRVVERYRDLIENWTPPSQLSERTDIGDEGWLFGRKHQEKPPEKKVRLSSEMPSSSGSLLWPRAHYLHDADVYALPYTVPF